jgi:hypothetical protein
MPRAGDQKAVTPDDANADDDGSVTIETTTTTIVKDKEEEEDEEVELMGSVVEDSETEEIQQQEKDVELMESAEVDDNEQREEAVLAEGKELSPEEIRERSSRLRKEGKELHDEGGSFGEAAEKFGAAADLLLLLLDASDVETEEVATLRLHQALCHLKDGSHDEAERAASAVLELEGVAAPLRARAFHRRAKARLAAGDVSSALQDARQAAFLGDRKAVALYGKLMREHSSSTLSDSGTAEGSGNFGSQADLLESLLTKSGMRGTEPLAPPSLPSLFQNMGKNAGNGGLAKSVLTSLSKRLDDEATQETVCTYLQGCTAVQLQSLAHMVGFPLPTEQAAKLAAFCRSVTPATLRRTIRLGKRTVWSVQLIRKTLQVIAKYRTLIIALILLQWIKSALYRPMPVNRRALRRAAREAAKAAAKENGVKVAAAVFPLFLLF